MHERWCMHLDLANELTTARYSTSLGLARNPFCCVAQVFHRESLVPGNREGQPCALDKHMKKRSSDLGILTRENSSSLQLADQNPFRLTPYSGSRCFAIQSRTHTQAAMPHHDVESASSLFVPYKQECGTEFVSIVLGPVISAPRSRCVCECLMRQS